MGAVGQPPALHEYTFAVLARTSALGFSSPWEISHRWNPTSLTFYSQSTQKVDRQCVLEPKQTTRHLRTSCLGLKADDYTSLKDPCQTSNRGQPPSPSPEAQGCCGQPEGASS